VKEKPADLVIQSVEEDLEKDFFHYTKHHPKRMPGVRCWGCTIPESAMIEEMRLKGFSIAQLVGWLRDRRNYPIDVATENRVRKHLKNHRNIS